MNTALKTNDISYNEFKKQGVGELAEDTRIGLFSDYIEFRMKQ